MLTVSIPDILNMPGQVARCFADACLEKFVRDNLQQLRSLRETDLIKEFTQMKLNLRQGFVSTGMGDLQSKMPSGKKAKKRKADIESRNSGNCCNLNILDIRGCGLKTF